MEYIGPAENQLFTKALELLWQRRLAMEGCEADLHPVLIEPDESTPTQAV